MTVRKCLRRPEEKYNFLWNYKTLLKSSAVNEYIQAIYENGILRVLQPLDLTENSVFDFLPDTIEVYRNWRALVINHSVSGIHVHDAKLVAAMKAHNIQNLLTFNAKDFKRYTDITAIEPKDI